MPLSLAEKYRKKYREKYRIATARHSTTFCTLARLIARWIARAEQRRTLADCDARTLRDLGISPSDRARECRKRFWQS